MMNDAQMLDMIKTFLRTNILEITFEKVDGTLRKMQCTLDANYISEHYTAPEKKTETVREPNPDVLAVFDTENKGWRSMRVDKIQAFSMPKELNP